MFAHERKGFIGFFKKNLVFLENHVRYEKKSRGTIDFWKKLYKITNFSSQFAIFKKLTTACTFQEDFCNVLLNLINK